MAAMLAGLAILAVIALSRLSPRGSSPETPESESSAGVPGIEEPETPSGPASSTTARRERTRDEFPASAEPSAVAAAALTSEVPSSLREEPVVARPVERPRPPQPSSGLPRIAIVLDDCGQRLDLLERASRIREPLTFAVIPHLPHSRASAEKAHAAGHEVIVHQPMEPESGEENPGDGVLKAGMNPREVGRILRASFADVPHAAGLNNHMGSRATADAALMASVLGSVAELSPSRPLYFLDSRTSAQTVAWDAARKAGLRTAQRDVFLDNDLAPSAILGQLERLVQEAASQGEAIGIGHLKPETLAVLEAELPRIAGRQARFVFLGDLVR